MSMRKLICGTLAATLLATTAPVHAGMVGTSQLVAQQSRIEHMAQVQSFVAREDVQAQMEALGVDSAFAAERVAALTDQELQELALNIETLPAGGVLGTVLVVLLILLVLELLGAINIFR